jgi:hypothetical protein
VPSIIDSQELDNVTALRGAQVHTYLSTQLIAELAKPARRSFVISLMASLQRRMFAGAILVFSDVAEAVFVFGLNV